MKKIINGKRYDTNTAAKVASYNNMSLEFPEGFIATLYRKRGGEYFLHGIGNAESPFGVEVRGNPLVRAKGERIVPLSVKEAMEWAKKYLYAEEYEALFGEVNEAGEMPGKVQVSFWVTEGQRREAQELGVTHAEVYAAGLKALEEK